jgi:uncharacterized membrane protein YfcA
VSMPFGVETVTLALALVVVLFGGLVKGLAGFGYAVASTALLATFIEPSVAVVVMILPMLAGNLSLVTELERDDLGPCLSRFWPYLLAGLAGTLAGMALLDRIPTAVLALTLGVVTLAYVATSQPYVTLPGESWVVDRCFRPGATAKAALGLASGVVFGASNIGVQFVAYLDALDLDRATFVGVLSMLLVGVSTVRVGAAWMLGLYGASGVLAVSVLAVVPGLVGIAAGQRLRAGVPERYVTAGTLLLLVVIGLKLTHGGATGLLA